MAKIAGFSDENIPWSDSPPGLPERASCISDVESSDLDIRRDSSCPIRVTIVQPALAKYRVPVFAELASRPGIDLRIVYGQLKGLPNVQPVGFRAESTRLRHYRIAGRAVMYEQAQWTYASRRYSDVLVLQWSLRLITLLPALLRARLNGVATVLWGHGYSKAERRSWQVARNWLSGLATALVFYDPISRETFIRQGWNPDKLFVALNSLDHREIVHARQYWLDHEDEMSVFRRLHGLDRGPTVLFVSRLQPANRVDWLIQATARLAPEFPSLKTVIIGNGEEEKRRLQSLTLQEHVQDNVLFVEGVYDEFKLAPWFLASDVFCYPANVGLSLLHAFWYGLPVVTSGDRTIQNPEIVALQHGVNGLTFEHGSIPALTNSLREIITDCELRTSLSQAARRTVEERFTIPHMVNGLEAAIRYAVNSVDAANRQDCTAESPDEAGKCGSTQ